MSGLRVALVRLDGDNWQDGTLIGTGSIEDGQPYAYVKNLDTFRAWVRRHHPRRVNRAGLLDYEWVRHVRAAFTQGEWWVRDDGKPVPFEGLALRDGPPRIRIQPVSGEAWESPLDVVAPEGPESPEDGPGGDGCGTGDILTLLGGEAS